MKMTSLIIQPTHSWEPVGPKNPLRAVVKIASEDSTVEAVLNDDTMRKVLDLCAVEIVAAAKGRVDEFMASVTALEGEGAAALLEEPA